MLILVRWRAIRLGGGIRREIILHEVGSLIDNGTRAFQSSIVKTLMAIHVFGINKSAIVSTIAVICGASYNACVSNSALREDLRRA